jgi:hypothetical protein
MYVPGVPFAELPVVPAATFAVGTAVVGVIAPVVALAAGALVVVDAVPALVALASGAGEPPVGVLASGAVVWVASLDVVDDCVDLVQAVNASATQSATAAYRRELVIEYLIGTHPNDRGLARSVRA